MPSTPTSTRVNFSEKEGLASHYSSAYAVVLDDVFTPDECASLLARAVNHESSHSAQHKDDVPVEISDRAMTGNWKPAGLSAEGPTQTVHAHFRNSDRILAVDEKTSLWIYDRLKPLVIEEIGRIEVGGEWDGITGKKGRSQGPTWELVGVNPRLSFLRYEPGHYFKPHCDGLNDLPQPDGTIHKSFVTLHVYLNGEDEAGKESGLESPQPTEEWRKLCENDPPEPLVGGSTRFWTPNKKHFLDVRPRLGRVLVFQQRMLVHSGEEVEQGVKYTMRSDFMYRQVAH